MAGITLLSKIILCWEKLLNSSSCILRAVSTQEILFEASTKRFTNISLKNLNTLSGFFKNQ